MKRFWTKVNKTQDCWLWTACKAKGNGYGLFQYAGRLQGAHRVAYELSVGPIPEGLEIDHLCRNRVCVNPAHLEVVTRSENQRRSTSPTGKNAAKTHCINGHEFDQRNTYHYLKNGLPARDCRTCKKMRAKLSPRLV